MRKGASIFGIKWVEPPGDFPSYLPSIDCSGREDYAKHVKCIKAHDDDDDGGGGGVLELKSDSLSPESIPSR